MPLTPEDFRRLALELPATSEGSHMDHPDFRVGKKIFATIPRPPEPRAMVKLTPEQQASFVEADPLAFEPVQGAWGRQGCTYVALKAVKKTALRRALTAAWRNAAPARLLKDLESDI
jgi:hypothetical protein